MARNEQLDNLLPKSLDFPYNKIDSKLSDVPRIYGGENVYVTLGGDITKRPGTLRVDALTLARRIDRVYIVETLDYPAYVYILVSAYNSTTQKWEIWFVRQNDATPAFKRASYIGAITFTGSGLNDMTVGGYYTDMSADSTYTVEIDGTGTPDTFKWRKGAGSWTSGVAITGGNQTLSDGITIRFAATTGHTLTNSWAVTGYKDLRDVNSSILPHEVAVSRGKAFIKAFPAAGSSEKLGSVQFDGSGGVPVFTYWGVLGPTVPARCNASSGWGASTHTISVLTGWKYAYCYETYSGQVSNRSPVETNPDKNQSNTGAFSNKVPEVVVQGHADRKNVPYLIMQRTADGSGTYTFLERIVNTGSGNITYYDDSLESGASGGTFDDPVPDDVLDFSVNSLSPTLDSNSPPATVRAPDVTGTDTPLPTSSMSEFAGRIWYAIGPTLYFSAQEEITTGVPEESFPTGLRGNYFHFPLNILAVKATQDFLYAPATKAVYVISGSTKEGFTARVLLNNIGMAEGHPQAIDSIGEEICWLAHDYRICILQANQFRPISDPLGDDIKTAIEAGAEIIIRHWSQLDKNWIVVAAVRRDDPTLSKTWIYDIKKSRDLKTDFWNVSWTVRATALASSRVKESPVTTHRLLFATWDGANSCLTRLDESNATATDATPTGTINYGANFTTGLFRVPEGSHVHTLRVPALTPVIESLVLERTEFKGDSDPEVSYFLDDFWTSPIRADFSYGPSRRDESKGYKTLWHPINQVGQRIALRVSHSSSNTRMEILSFFISFLPEQGV